MHISRKNRKYVNYTRKNRNTESIQHHHLLLRMEMETCPESNDKPEAAKLIKNIIHDLHMRLLDKPHVYYVKVPQYNEGLTAISPIQTSHIAFHFWKNPERKILHQPESKCLLEFDIYTCGNLTIKQIHRVLHHLTKYRPTHADITLLNRKYGLTIDRQMHWDCRHSYAWTEWLESGAFNP